MALDPKRAQKLLAEASQEEMLRASFWRAVSRAIMTSVILVVTWWQWDLPASITVPLSLKSLAGVTGLHSYFELYGPVVFQGVIRVLFWGALVIGIVAVMEIAQYTLRQQSIPDLDDLPDEQRKLLGLELRGRRPLDYFSPAQAAIRASAPVESVVTSPPPRPLPRHPGSEEPYVRTPGAAPSGYFRYERTPQTPASAGSTGNRPYRRSWSAGSGAGGGGGRLSFGGSAEKKVQDIMRDFKEEKSPVPMAISSPDAYLMSPIFMPYQESPIGPSYSKTTTSLGASPEMMDRRDWLNVLNRAGLSAHSLDLYTDNLRTMLAGIIQHMLLDFDTTVEQLSPFIPRSVLLHEDSRTVDDFMHRYLNVPAQPYIQEMMALVRHYKSLDKVFKEGYNWKECFRYVKRRLEELVSDPYLSTFDWDRGESLRDKNLRVELPSDADILMDIFLRHCDEGFGHRKDEDDRAFTRLHFVQLSLEEGEEPRNFRGRNVIVRYGNGGPPHFLVVRGGERVRIRGGKDNCFHAIILFLHLGLTDGWLPKTSHFRNILNSVLTLASPTTTTATRTTSGQYQMPY